MRKFLFPLLLATSMAATPAFAQQWNKQDRQTAREDRQAARQERQDSRPAPRAEQPRSESPARNFVPQASAAVQEHANIQRQQWSRPAETAQPDNRRFDGRSAQQQQWSREQAQQTVAAQRNADTFANWRQQQRNQTRQQPDENAYRGYTRGTPGYAGYDRGGSVPQTAYRYDRSSSRNWNSDWRSDRRYDWRDYRNQHRSVFRLGIYYDPFGYGYRPYNIGFQMMPAYYGQQYWLDPAMYDLPFPPPGAQWVRYWNDALLVDMYSGQVIDVIHGFFW